MEIATATPFVLLDGDCRHARDDREVLCGMEEGFDIVFGVRSSASRLAHAGPLQDLLPVLRHLPMWTCAGPGDFSLIDEAVTTCSSCRARRVHPGLRAWIGFRQTGVPYVRPERMFGRSTNNFLKNIWWPRRPSSLQRETAALHPGPGFVIFLLSMALSLFYLVTILSPSRRGAGITTIVLLVLGLGGSSCFP